jgi:N-formylglutamate deformylase
MKLFQFQRGLIPLMVSNPHSGTFIPPEIAATMSPEALIKRDTDWFLARLYDFPVLKKAGMIKANLSRYVIDLNRRSDGESLYPGQNTTGLCPRITFEKEAIYLEGKEPDASEVGKRVEHFWRPYHDQLNEELDRLVGEFGYVVFLDVHSIADQVRMLFEGSIPILNFGTNHGKSCSDEFQASLEQFGDSLDGVSWVANGRFIGGYITRHYGEKPKVNAVQLELNRSSYMDEETLQWSDEGAVKIRPVLESFVEMLSEWKPGR